MRKKKYRSPVLTVYREPRIAPGQEPFSKEDLEAIRREQERRRKEACESQD